MANLAHPGGNITGFQNFETAIGGKWLELLKEIAPGVRRVAVVYNQKIAGQCRLSAHGRGCFGLHGGDSHGDGPPDVADIEPAFTAFAQAPNGGLILTPNPLNSRNTEVISGLPPAASAGDLSVPFDPVKGGLVSYGFDTVEQQRGAAAYVDRVLKGEKPANLPVQAPTKYQLVINLKTAKALGLDVSLQMQQRADEVIE